MSPWLTTLIPPFLATCLLPELRRRRGLAATLWISPITFTLVTRYAADFPAVSIALLSASAGVAITSLAEEQFIRRVVQINMALTLLLMGASFTMLVFHLPLLCASAGLLAGTAFIAAGLMADIELQWQQKITMHSAGGLSFLFPRHSGWILCCLVLFGSAPGSFLFLIEDILLHEFSLVSWLGCAAVLAITMVAGFSAYHIYTRAFCGRNLEMLPTRLRRDPTRLVGLLLLIIIFLGLVPGLFLMHDSNDRKETGTHTNAPKVCCEAPKLASDGIVRE